MACYTCDIFSTFDTAQQAMSTRVFNLLGTDADNLLTAFVGVWTAVFFIRLMINKMEDLRDVFVNVCVFTFAHLLINNSSQFDYYVIDTIRNFVFDTATGVTSGASSITGGGVSGVISSVEGSLSCIVGVAAEANKSALFGVSIGGVLLMIPYLVAVVFFTVGLVEFLFMIFIVRAFGPLIVICFSFKITRSISGNATKMLLQGGVGVLFAAALAGLSLQVMATFGGFVPGSCGGGWKSASDFIWSERYFGLLMFGLFNCAMMLKSVGWAGQMVSFFANASAQVGALGAGFLAARAAIGATRLAGRGIAAQGRVTAAANEKAPWAAGAQGGGGSGGPGAPGAPGSAGTGGGNAGGGLTRPPWATDGGRTSQGRGGPREPGARAKWLEASETEYRKALAEDFDRQLSRGSGPGGSAAGASGAAARSAAPADAAAGPAPTGVAPTGDGGQAPGQSDSPTAGNAAGANRGAGGANASRPARVEGGADSPGRNAGVGRAQGTAAASAGGRGEGPAAAPRGAGEAGAGNAGGAGRDMAARGSGTVGASPTGTRDAAAPAAGVEGGGAAGSSASQTVGGRVSAGGGASDGGRDSGSEGGKGGTGGSGGPVTSKGTTPRREAEDSGSGAASVGAAGKTAGAKSEQEATASSAQPRRRSAASTSTEDGGRVPPARPPRDQRGEGAPRIRGAKVQRSERR